MVDTRTDPQYKLRLPADLKAELEAQAHANKRSMNAEIVARLEESFESKAALPPEPSSTPPGPENTLYIVLDADGMPLSWNEILTHAIHISRTIGGEFHSQRISVFTPEVLNNDDRIREDLALIEKYRELSQQRKKIGSNESGR